VKIYKNIKGIKEMVSSIGEDKIYALRIDNHDEARILLESLKGFKKMNVIGAPDSNILEGAVREIEKKILTGG
jgi:hypothetical protein